MKRIKTGITGLDDLVEGGFPQNRSVLVSGGCGTGKTIFSMQYIYKGASEYNEPGVYVTMDERPELIREDVLRFGWDLKKLEEQNMLQIIDGSIAKLGFPSEEEFSLPVTGFDIDKLLLEIMRVVKRMGAKRLVIDSIPAMGFNFDNRNDARKAVLKISYMLTKLGVTSLLISEVDEGEHSFGKYGVEEYVVDGVVVLHYMGIGTQSNRTLHIRKMRATKHSEDLHPLEISEKGITVRRIEEEYDNV
ncbi:MAG: ATPase domain-containing protein [Candidatus Diapherotrites archaeon]